VVCVTTAEVDVVALWFFFSCGDFDRVFAAIDDTALIGEELIVVVHVHILFPPLADGRTFLFSGRH